MKNLNEHIELKFYEVLKNKIDILNFEQWVYANKELQQELDEEIYFELISLNYKDKYAYNNLEKIILKYVNFGNFEIKKITHFLKSIINKSSDCANSIEMTYYLYYSGYIFLRRLGLIYGLIITCPPSDKHNKTWRDLTVEEQNKILTKFYLEIAKDPQYTINWFKNGKIIIKNKVNEIGEYEYADLRNEQEINQGEIETINLNKNIW